MRLTYDTSENNKQIAIAVAAMWKKLGVDVELVNVENRVRAANLRQGDFEVGRAGWYADYNDAQAFLWQQQTSTKERNFARFSNPDYDRLMDAAAVTGDESKRAQLLGQAEQNLVSTRVKGWEDNLFNDTYVKNLSLEK
jgi:oligopeptide transport system substrate-binding protein